MNEKIIKAADKIWSFLNFPFLKLEGGKKMSGATARFCVNNLTHDTEYIYQYFRLEKKCNMKCEYNRMFNQVGIVIQGQPVLDKDFTVNSALLYKRFFPGVKVVVSTWEEESCEFFDKCEQAGIDVIKTKTPYERGAGNLNCQLISSARGIQYLKEKGVKYVAKTRTDQRFNWCGWLNYLLTLLNIFPTNGDKQRMRLIFMESNGTYKYIAFHVCDFFSFGTIEDMEKFYSIPLDARPNEFFVQNDSAIGQLKESLFEYENREYFSEIPYEKYGEELLKLSMAEFYILYTYVYNCIDKNLATDNLLLRYWQYMRNYAVIVDSFQLQFYWIKYRRKYELQSKNDKDGKLDFAEWLMLYSCEDKLFSQTDDVEEC